MGMILKSINLCTLPCCIFSCSTIISKKSKKQEKPKAFIQKIKPKLLFPKSSPTPLLHSQRPPPRTKLQALEAIVNELEASFKKRVSINDAQIFSSLLETCYQLKAIDIGIRVHRTIPQNLLYKNVGISSKLLRLYAAHGRLEEAHEVFDRMSKREESAFPWNSLISGYAELGSWEDGLALYFQMVEEGVEPDEFTFPRVLKACGGLGLIQVGEEIHRHVVRYGFGNDVFVLNALVDMYAKCGDIVKARKVFDGIEYKDSISWNSMLTGYIRHELLLEALVVFRDMIRNDHEPDSVAVSAILADLLPLKLGCQIHGRVLRRGNEWDLSIANSLIVLYSNHGKLKQARWLFEQMPERDVVSWNSMISAHRKIPQALLYFQRMLSSNVLPNNITFVCLLSTCAHLRMVKEGEHLFFMMRERYEISPIMEQYSCLVNLYGRAGLIDKAYEVITNKMEFEAGPTVWGALLYACCIHGRVEIGEIAAENLFEMEPDNEHNFELLMKIYVNAGRLEDVDRVKLMMADRGLDFVDKCKIHGYDFDSP